MKTHPAALDEKVGFDAVRARLRSYTRGALGEDLLEKMRPADRLGWLKDELSRVEEWHDATEYDEPIPLNHVLDVRRALKRAAPEEAFIDPEDLQAIRLILITLRRVQRYFETRRADYPRLADAMQRVTPLKDLESHIRGILDDEGRIRDNASQDLQRIRQSIVQKQNALRDTLRRALRSAVRQGYATEEQPTIRNGRMVIPIRAEAKRKVEGFVQDTSATGQTVYIEPAACLDLNNEVRELQSEERREIERILRAATGRVRQHLGALRTDVKVLAQMDLLQAKARLMKTLGAVVPEVGDEGIIDIKEGRNPALLLHFRGQSEERDVVPLDLALGDDHHTLVITGPNAGGKTVAMKTVGLFALMLAHGLPLPVAPTTRFDLFEQLIVDIGDEQSIEEDLSTFSSHVANLRHMLRTANSGTLVLIDEAGTGTDPEEGGALAQAVLERLGQMGARTVATTHHGTLKVFAHEAPGVENGSMEFDQATLRPTYRYQAGVPGSSYAFEIAQRMGLEDDLLERARALAGGQKTSMENLIATFEARNQELQKKLDEAHTAAQRAEREEEKYEGRARKIERERDEIRQQALEEAERIVQGANARIERTIREIKEAEAEKEATRKARERFGDYREEVSGHRERGEAPPEEEPAEAPGEAPSAPEPSGGNGQAASSQRAEEPAPKPQPGAPIAEGDQVVLDGGSSAGEVLEIDDGEAMVALGAMRTRVDLDRLTKVGGRREQQVSVSQVRQGGGAELTALKASDRIDLRGERAQEARAAVEHFIDEAVAADLQSLEILHGKGTGALRSTIHEYLATRPDVAHFEEAPWDQGGAGVTRVALQ